MSPTLFAQYVDPDTYPDATPPYVTFAVYEIGDPNPIVSSGASIGATSWTVPKGVLQWNHTYEWRAIAYDGNLTSSASFDISTVVTQPANGYFFASSADDSTGKGLDPLTGNYTVGVTDVSVAGVGPSLDASRTYNSLDTRAGTAFGLGWSSLFDSTVKFDPDGSGNAVVTFPNGEQARFGRNPDGSYLAPVGHFEQLMYNNTNFTLTDKSGTTYTYDNGGTLADVTDGAGHNVFFGQGGSVGEITQAINQVSGRTLHMTWLNGHVATVSTDSVNGAALTWTYTYTGNELTKVCAPAPAPNCTQYAYNSAGLLTTSTLPSGAVYATLTYNGNRVATLTDDNGATWTLSAQSGGATRRLVTVKAQDGIHGASYVYDTTHADRLVQHIDALTKSRSYGYNAIGELTSITDENQHRVTLSYDRRGNISTRMTCASPGNCQTSYYSYFLNTSNPVDPRNDELLASADGRSANASDVTYRTTYSYDAFGDLTASTLPATPTFPSGETTTRVYTSGAEAAFAGGLTPKGLLASVKSPKGGVTSYRYYSNGDLAQTTDAVGLVTQYDYDNLGKLLSKIEISDSFPAGLKTSYVYDALGRVVQETDPAVTGPGQASTHTARTDTVYTPDGDVASVRVSDVTGSDPSRLTSYTYDAHDHPATMTDPTTAETDTAYDEFGNLISRTDPDRNVITYQYTPTNKLATETLKAYIGDPANPATPRDVVLASYAYDPAGRLGTETDAMGRTKIYTYYDDDRLATVTQQDFLNLDGSSRDIVLEKDTYDGAGHLVKQMTGNLRTETDFSYDAVGQRISETVDPSGLDRVTTYSYDEDGNQTNTVVTSSKDPTAESTDIGYDDMGRAISQTVHDSPTDLVTTIKRDQRGYPTTVVPPNGNVAGADAAAHTTTYVYDVAGRLTQTIAPSVTVQIGTSRTTTSPTTTTYFDTFGDAVKTIDADGNATSYAFDGDGRVVSRTQPAYSPPGGETVVPVTQLGYDPNGNLTSTIDALTKKTSATYDQLNNRATVTDPLLVGHLSAGVSHFTYDLDGEQLSATDPTGAETDHTYDDLGRVRTTTQVVRQPSLAAYTTTSDYDDSGDLTYVKQPVGDVTTATYDAAGDVITSTDPALNRTEYDYDSMGRRTSTVDATGLNTTTTYDLAGRAIAVSESKGGAVLRQSSTSYDADGNPISVEDPNQHTSSGVYDALDRLVASQRPVSPTQSIHESYAYDPAGNLTASTDGNSHTTITTYNSLGLPESTIEPTVPSLAGTGTTSVPDAPTGVTATAGNAQASVSWKAPGSDGGSPITGYVVTASPGGASITVGGSTTSTTVKGLTDGTAYTFTVHATNAVGDSAESARSGPVTPESGSGGESSGGGVSFVGVAGSAATNNAPQISTTLSSSVADGDLLLAVLGNNNGSPVTWTQPAGWPSDPDVQAAAGQYSNQMQALVNHRIASGDGGSSYTWLTSWANLVAGVLEYSGVDAAAPIDGSPSSAINTTTAPALTTDVAGCTLMYVLVVNGADNAVVTAPAGFTQRFETASTSGTRDPHVYVFDATQAAAGDTGPVSATISGAAAGAVAELVALRPAAGAGSMVSGASSGVSATVSDWQPSVTGATNGTPYPFIVHATNPVGELAESAASSSATPLSVATTTALPEDVAVQSPVNLGTEEETGSALTTVSLTTDRSAAAGDTAFAVVALKFTTAPTSFTFADDEGDEWTTDVPYGSSGGALARASLGAGLAAGEHITVSWSGSSDVTSAKLIVDDASGSWAPDGPVPDKSSVSGTTQSIPVAETAGDLTYGFNFVPTTESDVTTNAPFMQLGALTGSPSALVTAYDLPSATGSVTFSNGWPTYHTGYMVAVSYKSTTSQTSPTVPAAPTSPSAVAGDGSATVSWSAPSSDGGSSITGYTVTASPGGATATTTSATTAEIAGLDDGTAYTFTVHATNAVGDSGESAASSPVTPASSPAAAGLTLIGQSSGSTGLSGAASTTADVPAGDTVWAFLAANTAATLDQVSDPNGTYTVDDDHLSGNGGAWCRLVEPAGLPAGSSVAWAMSGTAPMGWVFSLFTAPGGWEPDGVVPAWSTNTAATTTSVSGSVPTAGDLVTAIATMFTSTTPVVSGVSSGWTLADTDSVPHMADGVADATNVSAGSASMVFSWTEKHGQTGLLIPYKPIATGTATVPGAPTAVTASPGDGTVAVSFTPPADDGGAAITSYTVTASPGGMTDSGSGSPIIVSGLTNGTPYTFTVTATNSVGTGPASAASAPVTPVGAAGGGSVSTTTAGGSAWTNVYDALGQVVETLKPGGVSVSYQYDALGDLLQRSGSGAEGTTPTLTYGYDLAGRMTSATSPAGTDTYVYDDRGLILNASGPSGGASFSYDNDGRMATATDASGTSSFTYDDDGRLKTATDPLTRATRTYGYDPASDLTSVVFAGGNSRAFGYDDLHRLTSDTLTAANGTTLYATSYGYDANDNLTSQSVSGTGAALPGANSYTYDFANRLTSWTGPDSVTTAYTWDDAGNRLSAGSTTFSYDAQNRVSSATKNGTTTSYYYTARGTLGATAKGGAVDYTTADAYDRITADGSSAYSYDAMDRLLTAGSSAFAYAGMAAEPVTDGSTDFARDPAGTLLATGTPGAGVAALTNRHGDLVATFGPNASGVAEGTAYDPFGAVLAQTGAASSLGFQAQWTDPVTGRIHMGARLYDPTLGSFISRDSVTDPSPNATLFGYGADNPISENDPTGHGSCDCGSESGPGGGVYMDEGQLPPPTGPGSVDDPTAEDFRLWDQEMDYDYEVNFRVSWDALLEGEDTSSAYAFLEQSEGITKDQAIEQSLATLQSELNNYMNGARQSAMNGNGKLPFEGEIAQELADQYFGNLDAHYLGHSPGSSPQTPNHGIDYSQLDFGHSPNSPSSGPTSRSTARRHTTKSNAGHGSPGSPKTNTPVQPTPPAHRLAPTVVAFDPTVANDPSVVNAVAGNSCEGDCGHAPRQARAPQPCVSDCGPLTDAGGANGGGRRLPPAGPGNMEEPEEGAAEDSVQLFRNVDAREFNAIADSGKFTTGDGMMEGKWFATTGEHAEQWGTKLNGGQGLTVETRIPRSVADQLYFEGGKLDGIGPGWYADSGGLDLINQFMDGIRVWP